MLALTFLPSKISQEFDSSLYGFQVTIVYQRPVRIGISESEGYDLARIETLNPSQVSWNGTTSFYFESGGESKQDEGN